MSAREAILDAAAALVAEYGATGLGVEQVNKRAGVSKGAFFYHFKTKEEMVHALLEHVSRSFVAELEDRVTAGERFTDALVAMTLAEVQHKRALISTLIAAVYLDRTLSTRIRAQVEHWTQRMVSEDGIDGDRAELTRLALDGLMISTLLYDWKEDGVFYERAERILTHLVKPIAAEPVRL